MVLDEAGKKRVTEITIMFVVQMIKEGKLDPDDEEALKKASKEAASDALQAYNAALEFMAG